jgi:CPA1 family monovalent cation:H+ antiporter
VEHWRRVRTGITAEIGRWCGGIGALGVFTAIACLLGITALLAFVNDHYLRLQADIGLLLLAVALTVVLRLAELVVPTGAVHQLEQLTQSFNLNDTLLKGVLCFMLFRGSVAVRWADLRDQRWLVLSLAFAGTTVACLLTGFLAFAALPLGGVQATLAQALLFGALIAATDPVAALAILARLGLPSNLETVIDGESLLNDGVAVVLFTVFAAIAVGSAAPSWGGAGAIFARELMGGCLLGVLGWLVIHHLLPRSTDYATGLLVSLAAVAGIYATAQHVHVSGPIATVVAGLLTGNVTLQRMEAGVLAPLRSFWSGLDKVLNGLLFVFVGLHVVLINPLPGVVLGVPGLVAILAVLVARALAVWPIVSGLDAAGTIRADRWGLTKLLTWGGLRGGLSLALAVSLPDSAWKPLLLNMTFAVVVFSIVVQGLTIQRLFTRAELGRLLTHPPAGEEVRTLQEGG